MTVRPGPVERAAVLTRHLEALEEDAAKRAQVDGHEELCPLAPPEVADYLIAMSHELEFLSLA